MKETKSEKAILISAQNLFWKHGIRRVTVEEICQEADVSKMTFYRTFQNKDDIAQRVLKKVVESQMLKYREIMSLEVPYPEKVQKVIALEYENANNISQEFIRDIYQQNESKLRDYLEKQQKEGQQEMINDFKQAQKEGWIRKEVKIEFIQHALAMLNAKMEDESFTSMYDNSRNAIMELTNFFFYGILSPTQDVHK